MLNNIYLFIISHNINKKYYLKFLISNYFILFLHRFLIVIIFYCFIFSLILYFLYKVNNKTLQLRYLIIIKLIFII